MAGQVMEAPTMHHQQQQQQQFGQAMPVVPNCKSDHHLTSTAAMTCTTNDSTTATAEADSMACYLRQLQQQNNNNTAEPNNVNGGEQCPRCASRDTKFCYYNNYNTAQPRHFCRACRRYWTLGGSLRNVPVGGSTRKRPRVMLPSTSSSRRPTPATSYNHHHHFGLGLGGGATTTMMHSPPPPASSQSLLGSLFALGGAAPLFEGRGAGAAGSFDLGLGLPPSAGLSFSGAGDVAMQMQGLGLRGGGGPTQSLFWPAGLLLDNDGGGVDAWKQQVTASGAAGAAGTMWSEFAAAQSCGGMLHGGARTMM